MGVGERLKTKTNGSTRLTYTGLHRDLEHLKIETRLIDESFECVIGEFCEVAYYEVETRFIDERFASVMGECVI